jgi:DNA-binding CsgD family transcriptional regulator
LTGEGNNSQNGVRRAPSGVESDQPVPASRTNMEAPLSNREREVLALLAGGASGAGIAQQLVLSPETVRTHIRNAMAKLGASSRAQAVALAVQRQEIEWRDSPSADQVARSQSPPAASASQGARGLAGGRRGGATLLTTGQADTVASALLGDLTSLHEVDGGAIFLAEPDGLSLRRTALVGEGPSPKPADRVHLGQGPVGRVALERRAQLVPGAGSGASGLDRTAMCVPMISGSTLVGVISLTIRPSRLVGRRELLLLQALATRVADLLLSSENHAQRRLKEALESFHTSWSSSNR